MNDTLPIDPDLFHILVCPLSKAPLKWVEGHLLSTDPHTRRCYALEDGIPIMLVERSQQLEEAEWQRLMALDGPVGQGLAALSDPATEA